MLPGVCRPRRPAGTPALSPVLLGRLVSGPAVGSALVLVTERLAATT